MTNLETLFLFIFVFSILNVFKISFIFIKSLLQNPPKPMTISSRELIFFHLAISYVITFILS
jgi:hypothetical protein